MKKILCFVAFLLIPISAWCYQYNFLSSTPAAYFNDQDLKMYLAAAADALNHHKDGSKVIWKNPKTGNEGYIIPLHTTQKDGLKCRELKILNIANHRSETSQTTVCKYKNGWKIPGDKP